MFWPIHKKEVIRKITKELRYASGDLNRNLNAWNREDFKKKGFTVALEVPGKIQVRDADTPEDIAAKKQMEKKFRMVITPIQEKGGSVYSRTSSLTRSVTGEGASMHKTTAADDEADDDKEEPKEGETDEGGDDREETEPKQGE